MPAANPQPVNRPNHYDVLIVGAGISGIDAAYHLQTHFPQKRFAMLRLHF